MNTFKTIIVAQSQVRRFDEPYYRSAPRVMPTFVTTSSLESGPRRPSGRSVVYCIATTQPYECCNSGNSPTYRPYLSENGCMEETKNDDFAQNMEGSMVTAHPVFASV